MSERLEVRVEVIKLARLLEVEPDELAFLERLPSGELRAFREQATDRLFDVGARALNRIAAASRLVPATVIAGISQRSFGPLLSARAAASVEPHQAVDVAQRLPAGFLTELAIAIDPRRVEAIVVALPPELIAQIAGELGHRQEHVTIGRFLAFVSDDGIVAAMAALDDEAILRTAFVLEHKDRLDHALGLLPPERLSGVIRQASELGLWPEALDLLDHLAEAHRGPIADVLAGEGEHVVAGLVAAAAAADLWDVLLPVVRTMSDDSRRRFAGMAAFHDAEVMRAIIVAAAGAGLWVDLVPLLDALPPAVRPTVVTVAAELDDARLQRVLHDAALAPRTLPTLLMLLAEMEPDARTPAIAAIDRADRATAEALVVAVSDPADAAALLQAVTADVMAAVERAARRLGMEATLAAVLDSAGRAGRRARRRSASR